MHKLITIAPIEDGNSRFDLVELADDGKMGRLTPHCKIHRAMNKVSSFEDGGGYWRCLQGQCRAGCIEVSCKPKMSPGARWHAENRPWD